MFIYLSLSSLGSHSCDSVIWDTSPLTTTRALHTNQRHSARTISHFSSVWNSLLCRTSGGPPFRVIVNLFFRKLYRFLIYPVTTAMGTTFFFSKKHSRFMSFYVETRMLCSLFPVFQFVKSVACAGSWTTLW